MKKLVILFIVLFLFSFTRNAPIQIMFNSTNETQVYPEENVDQIQAFEIIFKENFEKDYMKVKVNSSDENSAPLLCFSNSDENCYDKKQLIKNPNEKSVIMWLKKEEFQKEENDKFYIIIQCKSEHCNYSIELTGEDVIKFGPNFVYSYLIGENNKEMIFQVVGEEKDAYMTVALEGSSKGSLKITGISDDIFTYKKGKAITFLMEKNSDVLANIEVNGVEDEEYVTLSVHIVGNSEEKKGIVENKFLVPNGPEITSYLEKDKINKECYEIDLSNEEYKLMDKLYITGRIHTKFGRFSIEDKNHSQYYSSEIIDGLLSYVMTNNEEMNYICFELPSEIFKEDQMAFSFSLSQPRHLDPLYNYYPPQQIGQIYRRIIPKGEIAFFSGAKNDNLEKKSDYNLFQKKGVTQMYIGDCRTYPDCHYSEDVLDNLIEANKMNQMEIWHTNNDKSSAIGSKKYVIVAYCSDDGNDESDYCEFETSIFSNGQDIPLIENQKFSKYVVKEEKGKFIAQIGKERNIKSLTFDIMIFSGEVSFQIINETEGITYDKYFLANKVFFNININETLIEEIAIEYRATNNSFFTIQYTIDNNLIENIPSGESYLVQIDPNSDTQTKNISLSNRFWKNENLFLANFFELNCQFEVKREGIEEVKFFDGYAQDILDKNNENYKSDYYYYSIKIKESDKSEYKNKMCMLYIAGYENENKTREIIVGENINQQIIFENGLNKIRFLYPHADAINDDLVVHINIIDKSIYKYEIYASNVKISGANLTKTITIFLKKSVISRQCKENNICPIIVQVENVKSIINTEPMIEVTIRKVKNTPTYLPKNQAKLDFVCGDQLYYLYTEIGKNDIAEITLNFLREFGSIWAKIVQKNQTSIDQMANWRGIYRMPLENDTESLPYNRYTKELIIRPEDTKDCSEGCYLLMSIQISQIGDIVEDEKFYPFSILARIIQNNTSIKEIPKVVIQVDEFIIGNVEVSKNEGIFELFEIWLPHDSKLVEFDWQSSVAGLYIKLGGIRPSINDADFKLLPPGKDTVLSLTKEQIINKASELHINTPYNNSLEDINLVIGIWTDKSDSIDSEIYSLRVHQPLLPTEDELDIIEVKTDQKIMCIPKKLDNNEYRCLFVATYDDQDVNLKTPLLAYAKSINNEAITYIYGNYIERNLFDEYKISELKENIPTYQNSSLNSRENGVDYIYTSKLEKLHYMLINVITDRPDSIMLLTCMPIYNYLSFNLYEFNPNPTSEQLLFLPGETLRIDFRVDESIMVDIVTLRGHAEIMWKNDPNNIYVLRGVGDSISLSSGNKVDQLIINKYSSNYNDYNDENNELSEMEDPGFVFYISYHIIDNKIKTSFKEIIYGQSLEISFKDTDFPVVLYSKLGTEFRDTNVAISFKDNKVIQSGEYSKSPFLAFAEIVPENSIYKYKNNQELEPSIENAQKGNYDPALKTAQVLITKEKMKEYNIIQEENPTLYIKIDKDENFKDKSFEIINIEAQVSGVNDGVIPEEKVYHYGRLGNNNTETFYRLRIDKERLLMRIQIAFNSDNLDFYVTDNQTERKNISFSNTEKARGKIYMTFNVVPDKELYYLIIFKKSDSDSDEHLNNYAFKYINGKDESEFFDYKILKSPYIEIKDNKKGEIKCNFHKLDIEKGKANITYFFKVVENETHYLNEEFNTIAVTESPYYTVYERNPIDKNGIITLTAKGNSSNSVYLNVIAQVQQKNILEYVSYNGPGSLEKNKDEDDDDDDKKLLIILICVGVLVILIIIVAVYLIMNAKKGKDLSGDINQVSFKEDSDKKDEELLPLEQS